MLLQILSLCTSFVVAYSGYLFFQLIRFPAAPLLGSMAATGMLGFTGWVSSFDTGSLTFVCSIVLGINLGKQIRGDILAKVRTAIRPVLIHAGGMLLTSLACGYILYILTNKDGNSISLVSAFICTSTGGVTEMTLLGLSLGANVMLIVLFQIVRQVTFLTLIPYSAKMSKAFGSHRVSKKTTLPGRGPLSAYGRWDYLFLICVATAGGYLGYRLGIPAGTLFGSMTAAGILTIILKKHYILKAKIRLAAQLGLGIIMGQRVDASLGDLLVSFLLPLFLVTLAMVVCCLLLAFLLYKTTDYDLTTCLICSAPTGLSQIAAHAEEAGADVLTATLFHAVRVVSIVGIYPLLIMCFS